MDFTIQKIEIQQDTCIKDKLFCYIICMLCTCPQIRINHWQTTSFSEHKMTDALFDELNGLIDKLGEATLGRMGSLKTNTVNFQISDISVCSTKFLLEKLCKETCEITEELSVTNFEDLKNIVADIEGLLNKSKYLLTLE